MTEDTYIGPPRNVTADEINATIAERQALTEEEKRELSADAWGPLVRGELRVRPYGDSNT